LIDLAQHCIFDRKCPLTLRINNLIRVVFNWISFDFVLQYLIWSKVWLNDFYKIFHKIIRFEYLVWLTMGVFQQGHSVTQWIISSLFNIDKQEGWNDSLCYTVSLLENALCWHFCDNMNIFLCTLLDTFFLCQIPLLFVH